MHVPGSTTHAPTTLSKRSVIESAKMILLVVLVVIAARSTVQTFRVDGQSMEATLHANQYVLINKLAFVDFDVNILARWLPGKHTLPPRVVYPFGAPQRGDVVVFDAPRSAYEEQRQYIKRIIGLPGETIHIKNGSVYINGVQLHEAYVREPITCEGANADNPGLCEPYVVPTGTVVVLGDHRSQSVDSRNWHAQPGLALDRVVGKAWISVWSHHRWSVLPVPMYANDQNR